MNITYIVGVVVAFLCMVFGMLQGSGGFFDIQLKNLAMFGDSASVFIVVGCTFAVVVASFPIGMVKSMPKHFKILLNVKKYSPLLYIDQLVELAQVARKNGLLALEEMANQQQDSFFKQAIMLIVDANDPEKVQAILTNEIEMTSARHAGVIGMYDKAAAVAPAFGMVGTLIGLVKMLFNMDIEGGGGAAELGPAMGVALITTLYGCILAHMLFTPIATNLTARDEEEVLCKMIIVEGIMSIQSGENPKFLKEKLMTFMTAEERGGEDGEDGGGKKKKQKKAKE